MFLYRIINIVSGEVYIGSTKHPKKRWNQHKSRANSSLYLRSKLHNSIRKYGFSNFSYQIVGEYANEKAVRIAETVCILYLNLANIPCYNIAKECYTIREIYDKDKWREKLRKSRQGRKPSLGMRHTDNNKQLFSKYGKLRWDIYGRYPIDVIDMPFKDAHKEYGISKTHYYRLRNNRDRYNESI